jgi:2-haloacid dehalogenase
VAVRAVVFDVFGTVVDWRGSLMPLGEVLPVPDRPVWPDVVDTWRRMYQPALDQARKQERWQDLDAVNRRTLPAAFRAHGRPEPENAFVTAAVDRWHRLEPWPDSRAGLLQLSEQYVTATLSNGHTALLEELVAYGDLSFTRVLSAQDARSYKPDPVVYLTAADTLGCRPEEVVLVAAHRHDLPPPTP